MGGVVLELNKYGIWGVTLETQANFCRWSYTPTFGAFFFLIGIYYRIDSKLCNHYPKRIISLLTCFQLEVVGRQWIPWQSQYSNRLKIWHMLLYVCCGIANTISNKHFNNCSRYKNQPPLCNVVTNCHVI